MQYAAPKLLKKAPNKVKPMLHCRLNHASDDVLRGLTVVKLYYFSVFSQRTSNLTM